MGGAGMASANLELGRYSPQAKRIVAARTPLCKWSRIIFLKCGQCDPPKITFTDPPPNHPRPSKKKKTRITGSFGKIRFIVKQTPSALAELEGPTGTAKTIFLTFLHTAVARQKAAVLHGLS